MRYKGKICDFKIYNKFFSDINDVSKNTDDIVLDLNFNNENIIKHYWMPNWSPETKDPSARTLTNYS